MWNYEPVIDFFSLLLLCQTFYVLFFLFSILFGMYCKYFFYGLSTFCPSLYVKVWILRVVFFIALDFSTFLRFARNLTIINTIFEFVLVNIVCCS